MPEKTEALTKEDYDTLCEMVWTRSILDLDIKRTKYLCFLLIKLKMLKEEKEQAIKNGEVNKDWLKKFIA